MIATTTNDNNIKLSRDIWQVLVGGDGDGDGDGDGGWWCVVV